MRVAWKHGEQYTSLSRVGRKGTVVELPQLAQTALWRCLRLELSERVDGRSRGIRKQTPWSMRVTQGERGEIVDRWWMELSAPGQAHPLTIPDGQGETA